MKTRNNVAKEDTADIGPPVLMYDYLIYLSVWVCGGYIVHHCNGTQERQHRRDNRCSRNVVHHQSALCTMVHKGTQCSLVLIIGGAQDDSESSLWTTP